MLSNGNKEKVYEMACLWWIVNVVIWCPMNVQHALKEEVKEDMNSSCWLLFKHANEVLKLMGGNPLPYVNCLNEKIVWCGMNAELHINSKVKD